MSERSKKSTFTLHEDGRVDFSLYVLLDYDPKPRRVDDHDNLLRIGELDYLYQMFEEVSKMLFIATDNKHFIQSIQIDSSLPFKDVDIVINGLPTHIGDARIWNSGKLNFSRHKIGSPGLMLHELAHYLYGLHDEYYTNSPLRGGCINNAAARASIMEWSLNNVKRFRRIDIREPEYSVFHQYIKS